MRVTIGDNKRTNTVIDFLNETCFEKKKKEKKMIKLSFIIIKRGIRYRDTTISGRDTPTTTMPKTIRNTFSKVFRART